MFTSSDLEQQLDGSAKSRKAMVEGNDVSIGNGGVASKKMKPRSSDCRSHTKTRNRARSSSLPRHDDPIMSWETLFLELVKFVARHGHAQVPTNSQKYQNLSRWLSMQRQEYILLNRGLPSQLTPHRVNLLTSVGFDLERGQPTYVSPVIVTEVARGILEGIEEAVTEARENEKLEKTNTIYPNNSSEACALASSKQTTQGVGSGKKMNQGTTRIAKKMCVRGKNQTPCTTLRERHKARHTICDEDKKGGSSNKINHLEPCFQNISDELLLNDNQSRWYIPDLNEIKKLDVQRRLSVGSEYQHQIQLRQLQGAKLGLTALPSALSSLAVINQTIPVSECHFVPGILSLPLHIPQQSDAQICAQTHTVAHASSTLSTPVQNRATNVTPPAEPDGDFHAEILKLLQPLEMSIRQRNTHPT